MKLSVVIPAYNEEENIKEAVRDVWRAYHSAEIIVVDDASTDKTLEVLNTMNVGNFINLKVLTNVENCGHGYTVIKGLKAATGDYILYIDADRQIPLTKFVSGFDFVSGCRVHRNDKLFRKIISFGLKMTNLLRYGYYIKDANCPYKIYRRAAVQALLDELPTTHIIPIACLEVLARKYGFSTLTIPTPHLPYQGVRQGFLQGINKKMLKFCWSALKEITSL